jgi:hypothetical protein
MDTIVIVVPSSFIHSTDGIQKMKNAFYDKNYKCHFSYPVAVEICTTGYVGTTWIYFTKNTRKKGIFTVSEHELARLRSLLNLLCHSLTL